MTIKQAKELAKGTLPEPSESGLLKWQAEHGTFDDFEPQKVTGVTAFKSKSGKLLATLSLESDDIMLVMEEELSRVHHATEDVNLLLNGKNDRAEVGQPYFMNPDVPLGREAVLIVG